MYGFPCAASDIAASAKASLEPIPHKHGGSCPLSLKTDWTTGAANARVISTIIEASWRMNYFTRRHCSARCHGCREPRHEGKRGQKGKGVKSLVD